MESGKTDGCRPTKWLSVSLTLLVHGSPESLGKYVAAHRRNSKKVVLLRDTNSLEQAQLVHLIENILYPVRTTFHTILHMRTQCCKSPLSVSKLQDLSTFHPPWSSLLTMAFLESVSTSIMSSPAVRQRGQKDKKAPASASTPPKPDSDLNGILKDTKLPGVVTSEWDYKLALGVITLLAFITRFWGIGHPNEVVFDEVHFGKV